jgi:hypothetical protein
MVGSIVTRRGMIGGLAAGVSAAAAVSSDTFISYARTESARITIDFLLSDVWPSRLTGVND